MIFAAQVSRGLASQKQPPGSRTIHIWLLHEPGEETMLVAKISERSDRRLMP